MGKIFLKNIFCRHLYVRDEVIYQGVVKKAHCYILVERCVKCGKLKAKYIYKPIIGE
jgi:hypothetical protein